MEVKHRGCFRQSSSAEKVFNESKVSGIRIRISRVERPTRGVDQRAKEEHKGCVKFSVHRGVQGRFNTEVWLNKKS
ncbi:hypothetical protein F2Q69_00038421 [Brassica cretica]|uniref:Uncharacterized protein n=1 Tax=Brassica cretica TaxID=69181 RepID=A0A8S9SLM0_BRACR|nr:hypothetical protein F2Q69_00038421 [Brassica cretica]